MLGFPRPGRRRAAVELGARTTPVRVVTVALALAACSSPPPKRPEPPPCELPTAIPVAIAGGSRLNTTPPEPALPVQLRLYQLSSEDPLAAAFFEDVWNDDAATLGEAMLGRRELTVYPGEREELLWPRAEGAVVLSAVAIFSQPRGRDWRASFDLPELTPKPPPPDGVCPAHWPRIALWLDEMKVQDGSGRPELDASGPSRSELAASGPSSSELAASGPSSSELAASGR